MSDKKKRIGILLILIIAVILRIIYLGKQDIWFDEFFSIEQAGKDILYLWSNQLIYPNPPVYYNLLHFWLILFGKSIIAARAFSASWGILLIPSLYYIGSKLCSWRVGLYAAILIAISPFHIYYSQEARMYSLLAFLGLFSIFFFYSAIIKVKTKYWFGYTFFTIVALYVHNYSFFLVLGQIIFYFIFSRRRILKFTICEMLIFALYTYRLSLFPKQIALGLNPWINVPHLKDLVNTFQHYVLLSWHMPLTTQIKVVLPILVIIFGFLFIKSMCFGKDNVPFNLRLFLLICLFCCIIIPFLTSLYIVPLYVAGRYEIIAYPIFVLMIAIGISTLRKSIARKSLIAIIVVLSLTTLYNYYFLFQKSNIKSVSTFISKNASKNDILVFTNLTLGPFLYYQKDYPYSFPYPEEIPGGYIHKKGLSGEWDYINSQINILLSKILLSANRDSKIWLLYIYDPSVMNSSLLKEFNRRFELIRCIDFSADKYISFQVNKCYEFILRQ
jgi:uncharacterized membrane protein